MDDHGLDAHFAAGALDTERDLATIGDEDFFKHSGNWIRRYREGIESAKWEGRRIHMLATAPQPFISR
jgi:hypothetical protein